MATVSLNKFSPDLQRQPHFQELLNEINRSPYLVAQINQYPGKIALGAPGSGGFYHPGDASTNEQINIDKDWLQDQYNEGPVYWKKLATAVAHEVSHAMLPDGHRQVLSAANPGEAVLSGVYAEGVARRNEYYVSLELNCPM